MTLFQVSHAGGLAKVTRCPPKPGVRKANCTKCAFNCCPRSLRSVPLFPAHPPQVLNKGKIHKVPASDMEALKSPLMGLFEKRRAMGFFKYVQNYVPEGTRGCTTASFPTSYMVVGAPAKFLQSPLRPSCRSGYPSPRQTPRHTTAMPSNCPHRPQDTQPL